MSAYLTHDGSLRTGSAYIFRGLDTSSGIVNENAKLIASDGDLDDRLGWSASLSGNIALIGAQWDDDNASNSGSVYVFQGLDTATGTVNENAKLIASDGAANDLFGSSASISGNIGIVGSPFNDENGLSSGSAYVFQNLDTAIGTVTESAKLTASDGETGDNFGRSASQSGNAGLVSATGDSENGINSGSAYLFRGLDTATGLVNENAKLTASDGDANDFFGGSLSMSGNAALVGASEDDDNGSTSGSAYVFRGLDTATGTVNESAKLNASDGNSNDKFGFSVSMSGNIGLIGSYRDDDNGTDSGSAYLFQGLDTAAGTINETVKLTASHGSTDDGFGRSVGIDGDRFTIGAHHGSGVVSNSGSAYTGTVSSMTTLDTGNTSRIIERISFQSRSDWIIGETTSINHVELTQDDSAEVQEFGKSVLIGANAGSNENSLTISGNLVALQANIGSEGNFGNRLIFNSTATNAVDALKLYENNSLVLEGEFTTFELLDAELGSTELFAVFGGIGKLITGDNFDTYLLSSFDSTTGYTTFTAATDPVQVDIAIGGIDEVQRSMLTKIDLSFDAQIDIGNGAFELVQRGNAGNSVDLTSTVENPVEGTNICLKFSGPLTESSGSLVDGNYQLTIDESKITIDGIALDLDGDGIRGGLFEFGDEESDGFFRLFGDVNQSRLVNVIDLLGFRQTYLLVTGDASFDESLDSNLDGIINVIDLLKFRQNYRKGMPFDEDEAKSSSPTTKKPKSK